MPGLSSHAEFVTADEAHGLIAAVDGQPWLTEMRRRVQHYGYRYDYKARSLRADMYLGPLPPWSQSLVTRLQAIGAFEHEPDQLIVNEYQPGQGIAPHIDCISCFGDVVASLGLGSSCVMDFSRPSVDGSASLFFPPRMLLLLRDDARPTAPTRPA